MCAAPTPLFKPQGNNRVQRFTSSGEFIAAFGSPGSGNGHLSFPSGIAIDGTWIWVVDSGNSRVQHFSLADYSYVSQFAYTSAALSGIDVDPANSQLLVADYGNSVVKRYSAAGAVLMTYGSGNGTGDGQSQSPYDVAVGPGGQVRGGGAAGGVQEAAR